MGVLVEIIKKWGYEMHCTLTPAIISGEHFSLWSRIRRFETEQRHTFFMLSLFRKIRLQITFR